MQELLNLILEINDKTQYTASLRYTPYKLTSTDRVDNFAVDLLLNDENVLHEHHTSFKYIPDVIKNLKDAIAQETRYEVYFSDGVFNLNKQVATYDLAIAEKKAIDERYGVNCEIKEVI